MALATLFRTFAVDFAGRLGLYEERTKQYLQVISDFLSRCNEPHTLTILDVGTGTGELAMQVAKVLRSQTVGLDKSPSFSKISQDYFSPIIADANSLPFKQNSFDIVLLTSLLEHLPHPKTCIHEVARILKYRGSCIVQLPNLQWFIEPHTKWFMLYLMPSSLIRIIKKSTGYSELNLTVTAKSVCSWFSKEELNYVARKKIYHKLTPFSAIWPPSLFMVFKKYHSK
jgi:ubiquinone/menaquinone biosynthesis C-methylase UbiE